MALSDLTSRVALRIAKWALARKDVSKLSLNDIRTNWKAYMGCGISNERKSIPWASRSIGFLKPHRASMGSRVLLECFAIVRVMSFLRTPSMLVCATLIKRRC